MSTTRIFVGKDRHKFSSAHMTVFPDGTKERLHGHNYQVRVGVDLRDTRFENFIDFRAFKVVMEEICASWDERLLLAESCPFFTLSKRTEKEVEFVLCGSRDVIPAEDIVFLPVENISVETLASQFADLLVQRIKQVPNAKLIEGILVSISEASGQGCEHYRKLAG